MTPLAPRNFVLLFSRGRFSILATTFLLAAVATTAEAHPFHTSIAEAEWNEKSGRLEVALKLRPENLERALRLRTKRNVVLERTPELDQIIRRYLNDKFVIEDAGKRPAKLIWVGKEVTLKEVWLYFEFPMPDGPAGMHLTNRVLFDLGRDQVNTVNFRLREKRTSLTFSREKPRQPLPQ
jgi:hypothetical protein